MSEQTTAIQKVETENADLVLRSGTGFVVDNVNQAWRVSKLIIQSGLAPKGMDSPQKLVLAMAHGAALGLPPLQAIQSIASVNGRPSIYGDAALALVRKSGLIESYAQRYEQEDGDLCAVVSAKRKDTGETLEERFSMSDAKKAGLAGKSGPWSQYPRRMLMWRARGYVLRDLFGDVLAGLVTTEEALDMPASEYRVLPDATPASDPLGLDEPEPAPAVADEPEPDPAIEGLPDGPIDFSRKAS